MQSYRQEMRNAVHAIDGIVPARILPPSPLSGGPRQSSFFDLWDHSKTSSPCVYPQGPPLKEDGEQNPEAWALADIALGQIGTDLQGNSFQLLRASREQSPRKILIRSLDYEEIFWVDVDAEHSVLADTVSYRELPEDKLYDWRGSLERALWEFCDGALWDMRVQNRDHLYTLIGDWVLCEEPRATLGMKRSWARRYPSAAEAYLEIDRLARNAEVYPAIKHFSEQIARGVSPSPEDRTDRLRHSVRLGLLGKVHPMNVATDLYSAARMQKSEDLQRSLDQIATGVLHVSGMNWEEDKGFNEIAPLWRRISLIRLED